MALSNDEAILHLIADEVGVSAPSQTWKSLDDFLPFFEKMRQEGAVVLIKFDGERKKGIDTGPYTAAVTGAVMGEDFFRIDSHSLTDALTHMVVHYARLKWKIAL